MRIELAGSLLRPEVVVLRFVANQNISIETYRDRGYTHFEVICIGGGGGSGGGIVTGNTGTEIRNYGGAGGGGGFHQVRGLLSALPEVVAVVVGAKGNDGANHVSNPALTTDGSDGGYSAFNSPTCRASGGKGGKRAQSNSLTVSTDADGGEGGIGNSLTAGGGAPGGVAGTPTDPSPGTPGTDGQDGALAREENIGAGGGGGAGGIGHYNDQIVANAATAGGRGSYDASDPSVYGLGTSPSNDPDSLTPIIVPGKAGGAKASRLNGLPTVYGRSGEKGVVILRLSKEL